MFYEKFFINSLLKCECCNEAYDEYAEPDRILPCCGKIICIKCINKIESKNNHFKCGLSNEQNFYVSSKGFPINELALKLLAH